MSTIDINTVYSMFEEIKHEIKEGKQGATPVPFNLEEIHSIKEEVLNSNNVVVETLGRIEENITHPRTEKKHIVHSINPKSLGYVIPFVLLLIFWGSTLVFLYNLKFEMERMSDNDLKYRYIKMRGGISADSIINLEKKFYPTKDTYWIQAIQRNVYKYEETIREEAINITNAKMKREEAKRLQDDMNELGLE